MRLDESELEELKQWGQALREADSEESAAAGRAILLLLEELERLRLQLRLAGGRPEPEYQVPHDEVDADVPVPSTLQQRLQRVLGRDSGESVEARPETDSSAHSWIETMRREQ
jgi:hypothetical protein